MPQFDATYFVSQIFWLIISFVVLYIIIAKWALPKVNDVIAKRIAEIDENLEQADIMKNEAQQILANYEKNIEQANRKSHQINQQAYEKAVANSEKQKQILQAEVSDMIAKAEQDIEKQKEKQFEDFKKEQILLTEMLLSKIADISISKSEIAKVVKEAEADLHN